MTVALTEEAILDRMTDWVAEALGVGPEEVDADAELATLGLDSIRAFALTGDIAEWLDLELSATLMWEHPTLRRLAAFLAEAQREAGGAGGPR